MNARESVLDEIVRLLDADDHETTNTSMRLPVTLRDAAALVVDHLGIAASATTLTAVALRQALETAVLEAALAAHVARHPHARPSAVDVALALAEQEGSPLATRPDALRRAARQLADRRPDASPADILLWAEAQQAVAA
jgi:hypothetical protein